MHESKDSTRKGFFKTMFYKTTAMLGAVALLSGVCSVSHAAPAPSHPSARDVQFMKTLAQGNTAEIQQAKLAISKTRDTQVHNVAETIVQDHSQAGAGLMQVARKEGVRLPHGVGPMNQATYAKLSRLHGASFNRTYIAGQTKTHDKTVTMIRHEMAVTHNRLLLAFLRETLPKILGHRAELHQINVSMKMGRPGPKQNGLKHMMAK
jgi:putative membrane protein